MTKIAIASCCKIQWVKAQIAWKDIESEKPDLLLLLGDNVYMNNSKWDHDGMEQSYRRQMKEPNFSSLIEHVPFLATWDDHDFGVNDSRGAEIQEWKRKKSRALFREFMIDKRLKNRVSMPRGKGVYSSMVINDIKIIMLDVRYYRTGSKRTAATLLGDQQEEWFWNELDNKQRYTIVASGSCIKDGADGEKWVDFGRFYRAFRERVSRPDRVLFVSGDIHRNKFRDHGSFFEAISSGIGRPKMHGTYPNRRRGKPLDNYGILDFSSSRVTVRLKGRFSYDNHERVINAKTWTLKN